MTQIKPEPIPDSRAPSRFPDLFLPVVVAVGVAATVAGISSLAGTQLDERAIAAAGLAGILAGLWFIAVARKRTDRNSTRRALENIQARVGDLVEYAMDAIVSVNEEQRVVQFNAAAEHVFLWPRAAVLGQPLHMLIPERFRAAHESHVDRFGRTAVTSRGMGAQRVLFGVRANGEEFPIEASISQHVESGSKRFTVILRDVTERIRSEDALRRSKEEIQSLALAASAAQEQEKRRIARELHDELGQALTALKMDVGALRESLAGSNEFATRKLDSMQELLDATVAAARRISADLRPMMLDDLGLTAAADWLTQNFSERTGVPCDLVLDESTDFDFPDPYATAIFRVLQESLTNIAKHAAATQVEASLERAGDEVVLTVRDNGKGMATGSASKPGSFGLVGLRERAYLLGGSITIDSAPGQGTVVEFRIPLPEPGKAAQ